MKTVLITKNTLIGDIVNEFPEVVDVLASYGVHCVGCSASPYESLEIGFKSHGMDDTAVEEAVGALNKVLEEKQVVVDADDLSLTLTDAAVARITTLLADGKHTALRLRVVPGGCSGSSYLFALEEQTPRADDLAIVQDGAVLFVDQGTLEKVNGSEVHYKDTLQGAGFDVQNPQASASCGCGKSFK